MLQTLLLKCVDMLCSVVCILKVIHKHFYLKRIEIMAQCEEWIADIQQYSSDKRVGRTMSHHAAALKVSCDSLTPKVKGRREPKKQVATVSV